jgi:hypothetical protein
VEVCGHEVIVGPTSTELDFHYERRSYIHPHSINPHQVIATNVYQLWTVTGSTNCPIVEYIMENADFTPFTEQWAYLDSPTGNLMISTWNGLNHMFWIYPKTEAGEVPINKMKILIEVCGLETVDLIPSNANLTKWWYKQDNTDYTLAAASYRLFQSNSTFCDVTNYDLVRFDGSSYVPYTGTTVTIDSATGDIKISLSVPRTEVVYVQATTRGQRISNPNFKIDVEVCGSEQITLVANSQFTSNLVKVARFAKSSVGELFFFTKDELFASFQSSSKNCVIE